MKLYPFVALAGIAALTSCGNLNDPVYYNNGSAPEKKSAPAVAQNTEATAPNSSRATATTTPKTTSQAKPQGFPKNNSPFIQPDVYGMPSKDDLKETSSATRPANSAPGLTVPN